MNQEKIAQEFVEDLAKNQQDLPPEFMKVLKDNYWKLLDESNTETTNG